MKVGAVITVGPGRVDNAVRTIEHLASMTEVPDVTVVVFDGPEAVPPNLEHFGQLIVTMPLLHFKALPAKHQPGAEQPRNAGARELIETFSDLTHVWFLDSDILPASDALMFYRDAAQRLGDDVVLIGPYDWMPPGEIEPMPELYNDPRWAMFHERDEGPFVADLGVALGCFGGNLVWPLEAFARVGGFHPMLHHGRCEDGELGLRAASARVPMALVPSARGWHVEHPRDVERAMQMNQRDVPLLNSWHPWVEGQGLIVTDQDGARFDFACSCGAQVNTLEMWTHIAQHGATEKPDLILPDGLR